MPALRALIRYTLRHWLVIALLTSVVMLGIAHAFQTFGGLQPCHLCLQQRTVYWVAIGVAVFGLIIGRLAPTARWTWIVEALLAVAFLIGMAIAIRHAGAEWKWWPGPEGCSGVGRASVADVLRLLNGGKSAQPRCDEAPWVFLGLSMAGWNALISLKLVGWSVAAAIADARAPGRAPIKP